MLFGGKCECSDGNANTCVYFVHKDTILILQDEIARLKATYEPSRVITEENTNTILLYECRLNVKYVLVAEISKLIPASKALFEIIRELYSPKSWDEQAHTVAVACGLNEEESRIYCALMRISKRRRKNNG